MTTKVKHTEGPWEACDRGDYGDFDGDSIVILGDDMRIAVVHCDGEPWQVANARLIAASPTMFGYINKRAEAGDAEAVAIVEAINAAR